MRCDGFTESHMHSDEGFEVQRWKRKSKSDHSRKKRVDEKSKRQNSRNSGPHSTPPMLGQGGTVNLLI